MVRNVVELRLVEPRGRRKVGAQYCARVYPAILAAVAKHLAPHLSDNLFTRRAPAWKLRILGARRANIRARGHDTAVSEKYVADLFLFAQLGEPSQHNPF
jgi:hypothetical protein